MDVSLALHTGLGPARRFREKFSPPVKWNQTQLCGGARDSSCPPPARPPGQNRRASHPRARPGGPAGGRALAGGRLSRRGGRLRPEPGAGPAGAQGQDGDRAANRLGIARRACPSWGPLAPQILTESQDREVGGKVSPVRRPSHVRPRPPPLPASAQHVPSLQSSTAGHPQPSASCRSPGARGARALLPHPGAEWWHLGTRLCPLGGVAPSCPGHTCTHTRAPTQMCGQ